MAKKYNRKVNITKLNPKVTSTALKIFKVSILYENLLNEGYFNFLTNTDVFLMKTILMAPVIRSKTIGVIRYNI